MTSLAWAMSPEWNILFRIIVALVSVPALVALNGFFVAAEFALVAVRRTRVEEMVRLGVPKAKAVQEAIAHLDRSIAATQLGITLASISLGWVSEPALVRLAEPLLRTVLPGGWSSTVAHTLAIAGAFFLITFMHVVFGELIPKTLALQTPDRTALRVAAPLMIFTKAARPVIRIMNGTGNRILHWVGYSPAGVEGLVHSVEELSLLIQESEDAGLLSASQSEYARKVFHLSDKTVRDCMIPREQMALLNLRASPEETMATVRSGAHTRMPVYDGAPDNVVGVVNTKDLFYSFIQTGSLNVEGALYPALFLAPDADVADALQLFRAERKFLAVVRHAGLVLGIITLEDIVEEIVGSIEDEHDHPRLARKLRHSGPAGKP